MLVLTLKRFAQRGGASSSGGLAMSLFSRFRGTAKNTAPVAVEPDCLDLLPYCNPAGLRAAAAAGVCGRPVYQLVAASHHSGSLEGGHYTAQACSAFDGQW